MMSTLKPHLFFEMVDTMAAVSKKPKYGCSFHWRFHASYAICAFALSSRHAYRMVAYLLKTVLTKVSRVYDNFVRFDNHSCLNHPLSFEMHVSFHIQALMRIAGRYCTRAFINDSGYRFTEFHQPVFDGLSTNEVISSSDALGNSRVMEAVDRGRKVHEEIQLRPSLCMLPSEVMSVKNGIIKKLLVNNIHRMIPNLCFKAWTELKIERIEFWDTTASFLRQDIFRFHPPNMDYLTALCMHQGIIVEAVITMLKRYPRLSEWEFSNAQFKPLKRLNLDESLNYIQKKTDALWQVIVKNPATTITVECSFKGYRFDVSDKKNTIRRVLSDDFVITQHYSTFTCKLARNIAAKKMEVTLWI